MNKLTLKNSRHIDLYMDDVVYRNDNKITTIFIIFPDKIDEYPRKDCSVELRAILPNGDYLPYNIPTAEGKTSFLITNDLTEAAQVVKLMMIITHNGNVIGSTNEQEINVKEPTKTLEPLTPRAEFDEVIAEQRETISEQEQTITQQASQIAEDAETISGLNSQVGELESENAEQAATITRQNTTIDQLNQRVPPLETLDPINPSSIQKTYNPKSPNIGFPQVIINPVTAEGVDFHSEWYKEGEECLGEVGSYNPLPEGSVGGLYINEVNENGYPSKILYYNLPEKVENISNYSLPDYFGDSSVFAINSIKEVIFRNCQNLKYIHEYYNFVYLEKLILPEGLIETPRSLLNGCKSITELIIPNKVKVINDYMCWYADNMKTVFFPNSIETINGSYILYPCYKLEFVTLENGFNADGLNLSTSTLYSHDTILSWFNALYDRTGLTAYTLTIGTTNTNKMTAEEIAIATSKNWNIN